MAHLPDLLRRWDITHRAYAVARPLGMLQQLVGVGRTLYGVPDLKKSGLLQSRLLRWTYRPERRPERSGSVGRFEPELNLLRRRVRHQDDADAGQRRTIFRVIEVLFFRAGHRDGRLE